jgi:hypothetical protein
VLHLKFGLEHKYSDECANGGVTSPVDAIPHPKALEPNERKLKSFHIDIIETRDIEGFVGYSQDHLCYQFDEINVKCLAHKWE